MKFAQDITLDHALYAYTLKLPVRAYTLRDTGFTQKPAGQYELKRTLSDEQHPDRKVSLKLIINKTLDGAKLAITDLSGLRNIDIFKNASDESLQKSFYYIMDELCERNLFSKTTRS